MNPKPYFSPASSIPGIDEFIIGFKRMISIHFKQVTEKHNTRLGFKCLIDSESAYELSGPPGQGLSWFL